jgi:threonylcarbamoyladenosine tRNA methylthiotransferase MtaB
MNFNHKSFLSVSFGCRVNAAETNQWAQTLIDQNFIPFLQNMSQGISPDIILINTCSITKKGDLESLGKVRSLHQKYPNSQIFVTGCANLEKIKNIPNVFIYQNNQKEELLRDLNSSYTPQIKDKFSHTHRFLLKIQSGCTQFCSYCIVPFKRPNLWSLEIDKAIETVVKAIDDNYQEIIITGVNIDQYQYGFSDLIKNLLEKTDIKLISFGSIPLSCINDQFIDLLKKYPNRISNFLHIPIQSGSDKILKLMNRPYTKKDILQKFNSLKKISFTKGRNGKTERDLQFGTDIIVGFPTETDQNFQETLDLCQQIGFSKIHCFRYSSRPNTKAKIIHDTNSKISQETLKSRSQQIQNLI